MVLQVPCNTEANIFGGSPSVPIVQNRLYLGLLHMCTTECKRKILSTVAFECSLFSVHDMNSSFCPLNKDQYSTNSCFTTTSFPIVYDRQSLLNKNLHKFSGVSCSQRTNYWFTTLASKGSAVANGSAVPADAPSMNTENNYEENGY